MKTVLFMMALVLVGCSSSPTIARVKNCQQIENTNFYDCEEAPKKDLDRPAGKLR